MRVTIIIIRIQKTTTEVNKASQTRWPCQYCTSTYCIHTVNTKTIHSNLNSLNTFAKETGSNKVKLPKVGSNAIVPWQGPIKTAWSLHSLKPLVVGFTEIWPVLNSASCKPLFGPSPQPWALPYTLAPQCPFSASLTNTVPVLDGCSVSNMPRKYFDLSLVDFFRNWTIDLMNMGSSSSSWVTVYIPNGLGILNT
jgi:hypothetical protein